MCMTCVCSEELDSRSSFFTLEGKHEVQWAKIYFVCNLGKEQSRVHKKGKTRFWGQGEKQVTEKKINWKRTQDEWCWKARNDDKDVFHKLMTVMMKKELWGKEMHVCAGNWRCKSYQTRLDGSWSIIVLSTWKDCMKLFLWLVNLLLVHLLFLPSLLP